jgi:hypothetical protein
VLNHTPPFMLGAIDARIAIVNGVEFVIVPP